MRTFIKTFLAITIITGMILSGAISVSAADPIVLKAISFKPKSQIGAGNLGMLMDKVKEKSNGRLIIEHKGGPEVINPFGQAMAVKKGVVDMCWVPSSFYQSLLPWAESLVASQITAWEERDRGAYDHIKDAHMKVGLFYLGRTTPSEGTGDFSIITKKKTTKYDDLAGQKICALGPIVIPMAKGLGATPLVVKVMDIYTSLEQGIADACSSTITTHADLHLWEVTKYLIDHPHFCSPSVTLMNLEKWNSLPDDLKDILMQSQIEVEHAYAPINTRLLEESAKKLKDGGVEFIKFSPAEGEKFVNVIYDSFWNNMIAKNPDAAPVRKMLSK